MILLIDNYDSFAYNLYQLIGSIDEDIKVIRNDEMTVEEIEELQPSCIIISPGPGKPSEAGIIEEVVQKCYTKYPILGVCLGHQAIVEAFGGTVSYAQSVMHGKSSIIKVDTTNPIFKGIEGKTAVARYHSLAAKKENSPSLCHAFILSIPKSNSCIPIEDTVKSISFKNSETALPYVSVDIGAPP